jgi:hypothetical protein
MQIENMHDRTSAVGGNRRQTVTNYSRRLTTEENKNPRLTTGVDETFDRDGTISVLPSDRNDYESNDETPELNEDREPFAVMEKSDESKSSKSEDKQGKYKIEVEQSETKRTSAFVDMNASLQ